MRNTQIKPSLVAAVCSWLQIVQTPCFVCAFTAFFVLISHMGSRLPSGDSFVLSAAGILDVGHKSA